MTRYGMVIDLGRCLGCGACAFACKAENGTGPGVWYTKVYLREAGKFPNARRIAFPTLCMHCQNPPCVDVCPTGASQKSADGIVSVNADLCIGCKYCEAACPYDARTFVESIKGYFPKYGLNAYEKLMYAKHQSGVVEKCNFCPTRIAQGKEPACVATCPSYARIFGDLDDPNSEVSKILAARKAYTLLPELGTKPSVYYVTGNYPDTLADIMASAAKT